MYAKRIQLKHYGPIEDIDLSFPFSEDRPKPVVFVGENGSGKSILLSHIVNGLLIAQGVAYPSAPELDLGKVYKLRSPFYIKSGSEGYFAKVSFERDLHIGELCLRRPKKEYASIPNEIADSDAQSIWDQMPDREANHLVMNLDTSKRSDIREVFSENCILYFPPNRSEEPAWLNQENLNYKAGYMERKHLTDYTDRRIINNSPLRQVQNWLFDLVYDRAAFELQTQTFENLALMRGDDSGPASRVALPVFMGYQGAATMTYEVALNIIRNTLRLDSTGRLGIGPRANRVVSIIQGDRKLVPNVFQLSSGEVTLVNQFLSILRDFELCGAQFSSAEDVRGIVVVDEIDVHLHATHQYEVLPQLIAMFPKVQFLITSHSPLFVLGLREVLGDSGFELYRLPEGWQVGVEEFGEFSDAYTAFKQTRSFLSDVRNAVEESRKMVVFVDGITDVHYLERGAAVLGCEGVLEGVQLRDGGGDGNLKTIWKASKTLLAQGVLERRVMLLHDCDSDVQSAESKGIIRRKVPKIEDNPIGKGIENLFSKTTLQRAKECKPAFIDTSSSYTRMERGKQMEEPEKWTVNRDEKSNLCRWICENGTKEDFEGFIVIFEILKEARLFINGENGKSAD